MTVAYIMRTRQFDFSDQSVSSTNLTDGQALFKGRTDKGQPVFKGRTDIRTSTVQRLDRHKDKYCSKVGQTYRQPVLKGRRTDIRTTSVQR